MPHLILCCLHVSFLFVNFHPPPQKRKHSRLLYFSIATQDRKMIFVFSSFFCKIKNPVGKRGSFIYIEFVRPLRLPTTKTTTNCHSSERKKKSLFLYSSTATNRSRGDLIHLSRFFVLLGW